MVPLLRIVGTNFDPKERDPKMTLKAIPVAIVLSAVMATAPALAHFPPSCLSLLNNLTTEWAAHRQLTRQTGEVAERLRPDPLNVGHLRNLFRLLKRKELQINAVAVAERKLIICIFDKK